MKCILRDLDFKKFCTLTLRKDPKMQSNMHKIFIPKRIFIFLNPPPPHTHKKNPRNFEPPKIACVYLCMKISEYRPPPPPPLGFECLTLLKIEVIKYEKGLQSGLKCILRDKDFKKFPGEIPRPPPMSGGFQPPLILRRRSRLAPLASSLRLQVPPVNNPSRSSPVFTILIFQN